MGSTRDPEALQLLRREAEDACEPSSSSSGCPPVGERLPSSGCSGDGRAMRTCCVAEPEALGTAEKVPVPTGPGSCGAPGGTAAACGPMEPGGTQKEKANPMPALPEPCLKTPSKDAGSVPAPAKHVAFVEPSAGAELPSPMPSQEQPQGGAGGSEAPEQPQVVGEEGRADRSTECTQQPRTAKLLCGSYSFEVTPPQDAGVQDMGTQVDSRASLVSVALSPMSPPGGAAAFTFPKRELGSAPRLEPSKKDAEMQVSMPVETRSVATGPMTPVAKSPQASYPEVHVKGVAEEAPEPIREVSWDEKGMTWEVYGASMEVEVLGMAIQKHLEKQIEEHGRQAVATPQSTRASSIKGAPRKGEPKRQPSIFRALLQNVRRPRCCSRTGPAME
ncbi:G protein-regulated inducer of neurite outgrowth 1 [Coturnix japonica]|uniref:G protein-regulated inducer of neurite outgrowth 1 n=1 Tax=Coturnix japonica TaxID=93934 RepID=UPI000777755D|nr:G protein-regulated inducer of neurite outgrowth 1 [Coturnix japonica]XP_015731601.1 G protein-regulated inducer of neurite outgrowth 1 [Coturnix japonica]